MNEGSGWIVETIDSQYINVWTYIPLSGSSYIKLPAELKGPKKALINIKNTIKNVFYGVMLGILILQKYIQKELHIITKSWLITLIMMGLNFQRKKKILARLKQKASFALMCFVTKIRWLFQFTFQIKNLKTRWICCL